MLTLRCLRAPARQGRLLVSVSSSATDYIRLVNKGWPTLCVLKEGAPQFLAVPGAVKETGLTVFAGARAGKTCA